MALTSQVFEELEAQDWSLRDALQDAEKTITQYTTELEELRRRRESLLSHAVERLLPDLAPATIQRLQATVSGVATPSLVASTLEETRTTLETQLATASKEYDPASYDQRKEELESALQAARDSLSHVETPFHDLLGRTQVERLIKARYGKPDYKPRWYHWFGGNSQYFRDWEAADAVVEAAGLPDWSAVEAQYVTRKEAIQTFREQVASLMKQHRTLVHARTSHDELTVALQRVEQTVLERFQTKLRSRLEELDPSPEPVQGLHRLDDRISSLQEQTTRLHESRARLTEAQGRIQKLREQVSRSGRREVPDHLLETLRERRPVFGGNDSVVIYVEDDRGWRDLELYYLEPPRGRWSGSDYRERTWDRASRDYSGQS